MTSFLPHPVLSGVLALSWIALTEFSAAHLVLALAFSVAVPRVSAPFLEALPGIRTPGAALRLIAVVTWDIVAANLAVARLVLGPVARLRPAFFEVPLAVTHPQAVALLASIVTMTPGTVAVALTPDARTLLVHALDLGDEGQVVAKIKARYERPLMKILEC